MQQSFTDHDARIIAWIASMRAAGTPPAVITATLKSAQMDNWRGLPPLPGSPVTEVAMVPEEAVKATLDAMKGKITTLEQERDDLRARLSRAEAKNEELEKQLIDVNKRLLTLFETERRRRK